MSRVKGVMEGCEIFRIVKTSPKGLKRGEERGLIPNFTPVRFVSWTFWIKFNSRSLRVNHGKSGRCLNSQPPLLTPPLIFYSYQADLFPSQVCIYVHISLYVCALCLSREFRRVYIWISIANVGLYNVCSVLYNLHKCTASIVYSVYMHTYENETRTST